MVAPRGTANTIPFSCYNTSIERGIAQLGIVAGNASDVALGQIWGNTQVIADTCYATQNETGRLIGTAFVARDMMCIVDALGEDGMLRYWGKQSFPVLEHPKLNSHRILIRHHLGINRRRHVP